MDGLDQVSDDAACFDGTGGDLDDRRLAVEQDPDSLEPLGPRERLARTIEGEVIPRLLMVHRRARSSEEFAADGALVPERGLVERLTRIVRTENGVENGLALVQSAIAAGVPVEAIYLDVLAPAARRLGEMWTNDDCSFAEVTMGLCRLQRMMRALAHMAEQGELSDPRPTRRVLLASVPNEQHSFGLLMLEEFFRRASWDVDTLSGTGRSQILRTVALSKPAVVGLSASVDDNVDGMARLVDDIRDASGDQRLIVMVGGRFFNDNPEQVATVGGDFTAVDGRQAIGHIKKLLVTDSVGARSGSYS